MRPGLAIFALALVLLGAAVLARSSQSSVEETYRGWLRAVADGDAERVCALMTADQRDGGMRACIAKRGPTLTADRSRRRWRVIARSDIVDVHVDGDTATAMLRSGGCTLSLWAAQFRRSSGGEWRFDGLQPISGFLPACLERDVKPPAGFPDFAAAPVVPARG